MQMLTLWRPVSQSRVQIPCQVLLFDNWLPMAAALNQRSFGPNLSPARGVCQSCVATVTKHSQATPLRGLQTLIHHAKILHFLFSYSWQTDRRVFSKIASFFFYTAGSMTEGWMSKHIRFSQPVCLSLQSVVTVGTAWPGTPYSHFKHFSRTKPQLHFVTVSSSVLNLNWSHRFILLPTVIICL